MKIYNLWRRFVRCSPVAVWSPILFIGPCVLLLHHAVVGPKNNMFTKLHLAHTIATIKRKVAWIREMCGLFLYRLACKTNGHAAPLLCMLYYLVIDHILLIPNKYYRIVDYKSSSACPWCMSLTFSLNTLVLAAAKMLNSKCARYSRSDGLCCRAMGAVGQWLVDLHLLCV